MKLQLRFLKTIMFQWLAFNKNKIAPVNFKNNYRIEEQLRSLQEENKSEIANNFSMVSSVNQSNYNDTTKYEY